MEIKIRSSHSPGARALKPIRAAEYLRKSTEHQRYSIENQSDTNRAYAARRNIEIVRTYADEGRSGLTFDGREALKRLIHDVQSGAADFEVILVYDVSRWGRYQDVDESAYYEYLCKRAGTCVIYCAEHFDNDGSLASTIAKTLKRAMAGEYSRELSVKVFEGQKRIASLGFCQGGIAGYGLRRALVNQDGEFKCLLAPGEWKSITTDRVVLIPGPAEEIENIRWIFSMFVEERKTPYQIAKVLEERGIRNNVGNKWMPAALRYLLRSEKYAGTYVWNRLSSKLKRGAVRNDPENWVRAEGAITPIIDRALFDAAQAIFESRPLRTHRGRPRDLSDQEMLDRLVAVFRAHGRLSRYIIDHTEGLPGHWSYEVRFGKLDRVYALVGFSRKDTNQYGPRIGERSVGDHRGCREDDMLEALKRLLQERGYLSSRVVDESEDVPSAHTYRRRFGSLLRAYELIGYVRPYRTRPSLSNEEMLEALKRLWKGRGDLTRRIINETDGIPTAYTYALRFGGLKAAYRLIGCKPPRPKMFTAVRGITNEAMLEKLKALLADRGFLSGRLIDQTLEMPSRTSYANRFGSVAQAYRLIGYRRRRLDPRFMRPQGLSKKEMLRGLRRLLLRYGHLTQKIIRANKEIPSHEVYYDRFGCLWNAYRLIGYKPKDCGRRRGGRKRVKIAK
jgi:DNA invertase Pin-like site-specific DNA recombinase